MRIDNRTKGVPNRLIEKLEDYDNQPELSEEELRHSEESFYQDELDLEEQAKRLQDWDTKGLEFLRALRTLQIDAIRKGEQKNYIGERILYIREVNHQSQADLYQKAGVSKSTMIRCEEGINVPNEATLCKIVSGLDDFSLADFACFPGDFEAWKRSLTGPDDAPDIFEYAQSVVNTLGRGAFSYKVGESRLRVPYKCISKIKKLVEASFSVLELLPRK